MATTADLVIEIEEELVRQNKALRKALLDILGNVDYTNSCCSITAMVGAALPIHVIEQAHEAIEGKEESHD